jgi:murein DD-endopeptidase MepM/ murein hydrolase activator NlpD
MVRRAASSLVVFAALLAGCTEMRPVEPDPGQSWVSAKREAYVGPPRLHKVTNGDTASGIAQHYGVSLQELAVANDLRKPYVIKLGSNLQIPQPRGKAAPVPATQPAPRPAIRQLPTPVAPVSPMAPQPVPSDIQVATLAPPPGLPAPSAKPATFATPPDERVVESEVAAEEEVADAPVVEAAVPVADPGATARAAAKRPPSLSGEGFLWPTSGSVLSRFGTKSDGSGNDGINIAAPLGTPVLAAENGVVSYANDEIAGWGRMVLIRHADGFTTGYAHLDTILTRIGDYVARGQVIGRVGQTGYVDQPQLHFELRSGKRALDPSKHLVKGGDMKVASR